MKCSWGERACKDTTGHTLFSDLSTLLEIPGDFHKSLVDFHRSEKTSAHPSRFSYVQVDFDGSLEILIDLYRFSCIYTGFQHTHKQEFTFLIFMFVFIEFGPGNPSGKVETILKSCYPLRPKRIHV